MTRLWTISTNGSHPVLATLAEYAAALERAQRTGQRVAVAPAAPRSITRL